MFSAKVSLENALYWYQKKIGAYDKQSWEKSIEERVLKGLSDAVPKKVARVKTELIDLDLIRGSAFTKAKPQQSYLATTYLGITRVILFPFYLKWWTNQTNSWICWLLLSLYFLQISALCIFINRMSDDEFASVPISELLSPIVMFCILGTMQSQITSSNSSKTEHRRSNRHRSTPSFSLKENVSKSKNVKWQTRSELNGVEDDNKENMLKSDSKVKPLFSPAKKKNSDEESGLDCPDFKEGDKDYVPLQQRRGLHLDLQLNESDNSSDRSRAFGAKVEEEEKNSVSESEPEREISSIDCSPYSTVTSNNENQWKKYSDMVVKKIRNLSSRRYPLSDVKYSDTSNVRSKLMLNKSKSTSKKPKNIRNKLNKGVVNSTRCAYSSGDSEGSLSPGVQIKGITTDLEWPMINSDGTSDEDIEGDVEDETPAVTQATTEFFTFTDDIPSILNFVDDTSFGVESKTEKNDKSDKGRRLLKVSCTIWQHNECQKIDLSVLDISSAIIRKVESVKYSNEYFYLAFLLSLIISFIPTVFRLKMTNEPVSQTSETAGTTAFNSSSDTSVQLSDVVRTLDTRIILDIIASIPLSWSYLFVVAVALCARFMFSLIFFFLLCVAERTFRERFLYAKYFCHLTSSRRTKRSVLPHFRLNKVRNIKTWLSVRSYLRKHGPQRSVDVIVSTSFIIAVTILTFLCIQLLRESEICAEKLYCWEMVFWNLSIGIYIMRVIILGSKMNKKYRSNLSVLITEQINLYLQMEQKPHKKDTLNLANNVLKLAASLLKQLEVPFKISGFSANPYLYNVTKVIVLSAFSAVLTEMLGFKLKLYKIKLPG
ncbi:putative homeodomain transcription factor-like protein [Leptotrombidium deliense]|uniref:Putative homeodomain transcription factor-like protein n=1 Tax=Leptotrombidium deliense TaxID=299467 RepID=A0A443SNX6_9ACAR|nr:putative homeodomain transcription factor-like protein [Leptotrombidium deliense]